MYTQKGVRGRAGFASSQETPNFFDQERDLESLDMRSSSWVHDSQRNMVQLAGHPKRILAHTKVDSELTGNGIEVWWGAGR